MADIVDKEQCQKWLDEHIYDLEIANMAASTITMRRCYVNRLIEDLGVDCTSDQLNKYLDARDLKPTSRFLWLTHLNSFFKWAADKGYLDNNPTSTIKKPRVYKGLPHPIDDEDLILAINRAGKQMRAWIVLGAYEGLRCAEMAGLCREDIMYDDKLLRIRHAKGNKERIVPLHPDVWKALKKCGLPESGPIFRHSRGGQINGNYISAYMGKYFRELGIESTPHSLRHWFATKLLSSTHDLQVVSKVLGHTSIMTTMIYADWDRKVAVAGVLSLDAKRRR